MLHQLDDFLVVVLPFDDVQKVREKFLGIFLNTWGSFIGEENQRTLYRKGIPWDKIRLMEHENEFTAGENRSHLIYCEFFQKTQIMYEERIAQFAETSQFRMQGCSARSFFSHLIVLSTTVEPLYLNVHFDSMCRDDLAMCSDFLKSWYAVSFSSTIMWKKLCNPYIIRGILSK